MPQESRISAPVVADPFASATKVAITLHGREYLVTCGADETQRLEEIVRFVETRLSEIVAQNETVSETRLFMLTCLMMADELIEVKRKAAVVRRADEDLFVTAVEHLRDRVAQISQEIGRA